MSLILEALKKSEAERRLGRVPDLLSPVHRPARARRRLWPWIAAGISVVGCLAFAAWWSATSRIADEPPQSARGDPTEVASPTAPRPAPEPIPPRASNPPAQKPAPASVALREVVPPILLPAETPRDPAFASIERESIEVAAQIPPPPLAAREPEQPTATQPLATPAASRSDAVSDLPRLEQLSAAERAALPPLKQSMHVFAAAPEARFVLIDGRRYTQGERIANSLVVEEIRRDGTVLDFAGRRFLLPRP